jgi:hypothetical protein
MPFMTSRTALPALFQSNTSPFSIFNEYLLCVVVQPAVQPAVNAFSESILKQVLPFFFSV